MSIVLKKPFRTNSNFNAYSKLFHILMSQDVYSGSIMCDDELCGSFCCNI